MEKLIKGHKYYIIIPGFITLKEQKETRKHIEAQTGIKITGCLAVDGQTTINFYELKNR